jgi:hypothetical protein
VRMQALFSHSVNEPDLGSCKDMFDGKRVPVDIRFASFGRCIGDSPKIVFIPVRVQCNLLFYLSAVKEESDLRLLPPG